MARSIQHAYISLFVGILAFLLALNSAQSQSQCSPSRNPSFNVISDTCVNQAVSFSNTSPASSSVSYYTWQFGTGDTTRIDTNTNVQYTYGTADTFNVKLIAADTSGSTNCRDTFSKQVRISGYPTADFTMQKTPICSGNQQQFTNNSSGSGLSHSWDFGDGSNSTNKNPSNTYTYTGSGYGKITNQIKLVITNNSGCQDSITKSLNVSSNPTAGFNYASDTVCSGAVQSFTNTSNGVSLSYSYAFGDGSSSSGSSPTHIYNYTGSGYKNVTTTLTVTNSSGCQNSTSKTFSVGRKPDPAFAPTTSFDNCTGKGDTFRTTLYDNSTPSAISNYKVYWGDNSDTSLSSKPSKLDHTYPQKNIYEVTIEITNNNGCVDSADKDVLNIRNPAVGVSSPGNTQKCDTVDVSFPINNADSNFSTTNYTVTYGDGESGSYNHPPPDSVRHVYTANSCLEPNEDFVFEVKASNACASTKATVNSVKVFQSPVADFKPLPDTVCVNTSVKFSNNSTKPYNKSNCDNAGKYSWNFGDTSSQSSFAKQDVNHTYTSTGTFRPNLSITQVSCNASYDTNEVCVIPKPTASFTIDTTKGCQPLTISATNTSNTLNACAASTYTWSVNKNSGWSFTNSTNQNSQDATFQFTQPGKYIITLKDSNQCRKDTYKDTVTIQDQPSLAITNPGDFCESASFVPNTATFDSNFAKLTQNKWNFPGGTPATANQINPDTVNFSGASTYELNASFANRCGTSYDTVNFQIYQNPNVQAGNDTLICYNDPIALGDTVTGGKPGYTYQWQPAGKVGGDSLLKPTVSLTDTTTFTLKATDSRSCVGRDSIKVEVNPQINPNAGSDQFICYDSTTQLNGSSTGGVTPYQYNWSPAGKLSSTSGASVNTANLIQNQTFTLTVTDSNNCSASNSVNVDVNNQLSVSATVKQDTLCYNDSTTLQSSYSGGSDSLTVSWSPASKVQNATDPNPSTTGLQNTTDFVLTVTDSLGCRKRDTVTITVAPDITISTEADTAICFDDSLQLNASTSGGLGSLSYQWSPGGKVQKPKTLTPYTTSLTSDKTFTLTATDQFSCLSKDSIQVTVDTALTANAGTDDTYCGDTLRLGGNPVASGGTRPFTYRWTPSQPMVDTTLANAGVTTLDSVTHFNVLVTDSFGCTASDRVKVYPKPKADAGPDTTFCASSLKIGGNPTGSGGDSSLTYSWTPSAKLNDTTLANPEIPSLSQPDTFVVRVTDGNNCSVRDSVTVFEPLQADAGPDSTLCSDSLLIGGSPAATGGQKPYAYSWSGSSALQQTNTANPAVKGLSRTDTFVLSVTDQSGCQRQDTVIIHPPVQVSTGPDTTYCGSGSLTIGNANQASGGKGSFTYSWTPSSNLNNANQAQPDVTSLSKQTDFVLTATDQFSCQATDTLTVYPPVQAEAGANETFCDSSITLGGRRVGRGGKPGYQYQWQPAAKLSNDSIANPKLDSLDKQTTFSVSVTGQKGCTKKDSVTIYLPVEVNLDTFSSICRGDSIQVNSLSVSGGKPGFTYSWSPTDSVSNPAIDSPRLYPDSTTRYTITVTDSLGCAASKQKRVAVNPLPNAAFSSTNTCFGDTTQFTDQSSVSQGSIDSFQWDFGTGDTAQSQNPSYYFDSSQSYSVSLSVKTDSGCIDSIKNSVSIASAPQASFKANNACRYDSITFTNTSNLSCDSVKDFDYEFGDGDTADRANPSHQYSSAGTYQVTLTITTANQVVDSVKDSVVVHPVPDPAFSVQNVCAYDSSRFQDQSSISSGSIRNYQWDFGDGSSSNNQNPVHKYSTADSFTVSLTTTSDSSCKDTVSKTTDIHPVPTAQYQVADTVCFGDSASFTDQSTIGSGGGLNSFQWDFGDGDTALAQNPDHYYDTSLTFNHQLVTVSDSGCLDTATDQTTIRDEPEAAFKASNTCRYDTISFTNTSNLSCDSVKDFDYEFGDGDSADRANPIHQYSSAGTYQVTLTITTTNQVVDSVKDSVAVHPVPKPDFSVQNVCAYDSSRFQDQSSISSGSIKNYQWDFGDTSSSNNQNPVHKYSTADSFTVSLTTTSDSGCKDTFSQATDIHPVPIAQYQVADTVCFGDTASFTDQSTIGSGGGLDSFRWDFGDGDTALTQNPDHYYDTSRTFNHQLVTISDSGCFDTANQKTTVRDEPQASFTANNACRYNPVSFSNTSNLACDSVKDFDYEFGDGDSADRANPSHQYSSAGTYQVTLTITTANQVVDSVKDSVVVHPVPKPDFSVRNVCAYDSSRFQDLSSISSGSIKNYQWDFGDGSSSNNQNPVHKYSAADSFTVSLTTTSDSGCKDTISQATDIHPVPTAQYQVPDTVCFGDTTSFTDQSTIGSGGGLDSFKWDFGDGDTALSRNPSHYYDTSRTFNHQLVTISDSGCFDTANQKTTVRDEPQASFTANNACRYNPVSFSNTSNLACDSVKDFDYEFGDGDSADRANPSHQYSSAGTYQVTLTITTANQVVDSVKDSVVVHPVPDPAFSVQNVCAYDSSRFQDNSSISSGSIRNYQWDFGDGNSSNNQNPVYKYGTADTFTVSLTTTSDSGCKDTISQATDIHPVPTAQYQVPDTVCFGDTASFTDQSTIGSGGGLNSFRWDFGDGDTALTQNPDHYYDTSLTFNNELIVASDSGCRDTATDQTTIRDEPEANFTASNACRYDTISFTNTSNLSCDSVKDFDYEFSDGDTADRANPVHQYSSAGTYQVTLTITTANQVVDSVKDSVVVHPVPKPDFSVRNVCAYDSSRFQDQSSISSGSIKNYQWDFGDGSSSNKQNPVHKYSTADSFTVSLTTTSDSGCKDTISQATDIHPVPTAQYQVPDTVCFGDTASFTDQSSIGSGGSLDSFQWDFGDGSTALKRNPNHYYDTGRQFNHQLQVISDSGCRDTASKQTRVLDGPQAAMSFTNRCVNKTVSFQDQSTISCDSIIRHRWTFGDGSTASKANPDHTYTQPGQYRIKLVITLGNGAQDSTTRSIDIHPEPVAAFRTQNICKGDTAAFSSQSRISKGAITNYQWDFGDSSQGSGISPDHYYQQFGTYQTQLTVTSDSGCVDSTTQKLVVNPTPQPAFSSTRPCFGDTTRFSDSSTIGKGAIMQYQWQFGDGDSSLLQNPAHFYQQPGVYNTNLKVTSDSGCRASKTKQARVDSLPRVSFSIDSLICKNQSYNLTNNSTIADSFQWQFGDGRTFSSKTPNHTYQDTGSYEVKLVAFNNYGCADSFSRQVRVIQKPDVSFSTNKDSFCGPTANVVFSNFSTGYQPSYQWDLGNGQQRNQQFIDTIDYAQNNDTDTTYYITLTATNQCGVVQQRDSINVFPAPISRFTMSQDQGCSPVKVQFKDSATGLPDTYLWQFASDDTSQRPEPRHVFRTGTSDTTYGIRQITTNRCGRDTAIDSVTVFPNTIDAIFQVDTTLGCQPLTVDFRNLSSAGATRFSWQFGDGDISNKASPNHIYTSADTFSVSMVATNGCSYDTFRSTIRTFPKPDVQGQVSKPEACAKEGFELRNQTSDVSSVLWLYNNESDTLSTQPNATVSLDSAGQRIITQKVRSVAYDCPAKQQDTIRIQPLPSIAISLDTSSGCPPLRVAFSNDAGNVVSRLWEFGDGKQAIAANPVHTYRNTGNYTASLEATTDKGCTDSGSTEINVFPSPDAQFSTTPDSACGPPAESKLTDQSTGATLSRWNLPEGRQSDSSTLTVRLDSVGDYPIELVSRNRFGCRDTANQSFTVYPAPRADFEALNARRACVPHAVNLSSQAVNTDKTYWSLDGSLLDSGRQTTAEVKPTIKSDVRMVAIGAGGCQDTLIKADWLEGYPRPEARFDYQPLRDPEARGKFQFEDASRGAARVRWSFGDGTGSMKPDPVHRYPGNGTYKPELVATTDKGCKDTATQTLQPDFFSGLQVPNAIKPNSSKPGVRTFKPKGVGLESYHIGIYTKWGELVWESSELQDGAPAEAWDGTYQNGELCPQGSYVWKVKAQFKDGTQWQGQETETGDYKTIGTVTLIR